MKNLKITHILAMCLSFVPISLDSTAPNPTSYEALRTYTSLNPRPGYWFNSSTDQYYFRRQERFGRLPILYFSPEGAGHLVGREIKYYLPSRGPLRRGAWTMRRFRQNTGIHVPGEDRTIRYRAAKVQEHAIRGDRVTAAQQFTFVIDTPLSNPYFALQVSVDGYDIPNVEMLSLVDNLANEDIMNNPYKLANLRLNIAALCAQFCMFADQLQYNNTTLGRGVGEALRNKVREAMQPLVNLATQFANDATSPVPQEVRAEFNRIVTEYVNQYTELYTSPEKIKRAEDYWKMFIASFKGDNVRRPRILPAEEQAGVVLSGLVTLFGSLLFLPLATIAGLSLGATLAIPIVASVGTAALVGVMFTTYNITRLPSFLAESAQTRVASEPNIFETPIQVRLENGQNIQIEANTPLKSINRSVMGEIVPAWVALSSRDGAGYRLTNDIGAELQANLHGLRVIDGQFQVYKIGVIEAVSIGGESVMIRPNTLLSRGDRADYCIAEEVLDNPAFPEDAIFIFVNQDQIPEDIRRRILPGQSAKLIKSQGRFQFVIDNS